MSSHGVKPWPELEDSCSQQKIHIRDKPYNVKGTPCWEGQAVAVPELKTQLKGTRTCFVILRDTGKAAALLQQSTAYLLGLLQGTEGVVSVIDRCAPPKKVKELPINLTDLAVCFSELALTQGIAVVPFKAKYNDPVDLNLKVHQAEVGFVSPRGSSAVIQSFSIRVRHPGATLEMKMYFWLIAMPGM